MLAELFEYRHPIRVRLRFSWICWCELGLGSRFAAVLTIIICLMSIVTVVRGVGLNLGAANTIVRDI